MHPHCEASFASLPEELHRHIFQYLKSEQTTPKLLCKTFRLIHPSVSQLEDLKVFLFNTIVVRPTRERLSDLSGLSTIIPYVRLLDFEPIRMGTRGTMVQLISMFNLLPTCRHVILRGSPQSVKRSQKAIEGVRAEALLLADIVAQCLQKATGSPQGLDIRYHDSCFFPMCQLDSWRDLNLSELKALHFEPDVSNPGRPYNRSTDQFRSRWGEEIIDALLDLVTRSAGSLEEFSCVDWSFDRFNQSVSMPTLPGLRKIWLQDMAINPVRFTSWLDQCHSLGRVQLVDIKPHSGNAGIEYWRTLFEGIRDHPCKLDVTIRIPYYQRRIKCIISLRHQTSAPAEDTSHLHKLPRCVDRVKTCMMIKNYMSGRGSWISQDDVPLSYRSTIHVSDMPDTCCDMGRN